MVSSFRAALTGCALIVSGAAVAGNETKSASDAPQIGSAPNGWLLTVRGTVLAVPDFPGASSYGFIAFPSLTLRRADTAERWSAPDDGVSLALWGDSAWAVGLVGRYQSGRYRDNDPAKLYGIRDARWAIEPGVFGEFWAVPNTLRVRGELRYGINGYNGFVGNVGVDYVQRVGKFVLAGGPRMALGDTQYMNTYFGTTFQDALLNQRVTPYKAEGGVKSLGVAASATYQWNDQWATTVRGGWDRLVGSAGESPIVRNLGSRDQFTLGASASYTFSLDGFGR